MWKQGRWVGDWSPSLVQSHDPVLFFEEGASQQVALVMVSLPHEPQLASIPPATQLYQHERQQQCVTQ